jgi:hypothetical protein
MENGVATTTSSANFNEWLEDIEEGEDQQPGNLALTVEGSQWHISTSSH